MPTVREAVEAYIAVPRSPHTRKAYVAVLRTFAAAIGPERDAGLVTSADIADYVSKLRARGLKITSVRQHLQVIRAVFNNLVRAGVIDVSPAAGVSVRKPPRDPNSKAVPPEELAAMIEAARPQPRDYAILLFLADTGCRAGGLASLTLDNLDLANRTALLLEKGGRWHRVYFGHETRAALERWLAKRPTAQHRYVFVSARKTPLSASSVADAVQRAARLSGASRTWGPHAIRHAVGHALARLGVPVTVTQRKLGHASPDITMEFYYPNGDEYVREVSEQHPLAAAMQTRRPARRQEKIIRFEDYA